VVRSICLRHEPPKASVELSSLDTSVAHSWHSREAGVGEQRTKRNANVERRTSNVERRTSKVERRTPHCTAENANIEHRTPNFQRLTVLQKTRTSNIERRTSNVERKKIKERKKTPSVCSFRLLCSTLDVRRSMFGVRIHSSEVRRSYSFFRSEVFVFILPM